MWTCEACEASCEFETWASSLYRNVFYDTRELLINWLQYRPKILTQAAMEALSKLSILLHELSCLTTFDYSISIPSSQHRRCLHIYAEWLNAIAKRSAQKRPHNGASALFSLKNVGSKWSHRILDDMQHCQQFASMPTTGEKMSTAIKPIAR